MSEQDNTENQVMDSADIAEDLLDEATQAVGNIVGSASVGGDGVSSDSEIDILRQELAAAATALAAAQEELEEAKGAKMRALAEVQTIKRRTAQENVLARQKGADGVILAVLPGYDDLGRAISAAGEDSTTILPGIEKVRESMKRNLENIGITEMGLVGEAFDPQFHEALTSMPTEDPELKGTIAQVFESGFMKDDRVVRIARVVVYQD